MPKLTNYAVTIQEKQNAAIKAMVLHASSPNMDSVTKSVECAPSMAHHANHELNAVATVVMIMYVSITGAKINAISVRQQQSCYSYGS